MMKAFAFDQNVLIKSLSGLAGELSSLAKESTNTGANVRLKNAAELVAWMARESGGSDTSPADTGKPAPRRLSVAEVTAYLRKRGSAQDAATAVRYLEGGFSKHTILVSANIGGSEHELVFRLAPPGGRAKLLAPEFDVLRKLHQAGFPVAEPLWLEMDEKQLGGPFLVSRKAQGSNIGDVWGGRSVSEELCRELAHLYACLHTLDIGGIAGVAPACSTRAQLLDMINGQEEFIRRRGYGDDPELNRLLTWLREHIPDDLAAPALLHGDAALNNILVLDGKVSVILDWEQCHLGVAAEELAYLRPTIEPNLAWNEFLQEYARGGGRVPDAGSLQFFTVLSHVWRCFGCLGLIKDFQNSGRYSSAVAGFVHGPRFMKSAFTAIAGGAHE